MFVPVLSCILIFRLLSCIVSMQIALSDESEKKPFSRLHHSQSSSYLEPSDIYGSFQDAYIPFPRTSGAKFCSVGKWVTFWQLLFPFSYIGNLKQFGTWVIYMYIKRYIFIIPMHNTKVYRFFKGTNVFWSW